MKRRSADSLKPRRSFKRFNKFTEGSYGSSFGYVKMVLIWCSLLLMDFILEFRFEYLWPFWLLLQNICEYAKYPGVFFTILHVCFTIILDATCFVAIPPHLLFFLASSYVWVQYLWQPERGVGMTAITLWLVFVYIEASVRLKDLPRNSLQVEVCRPLASHCVGYPMVTLSTALGKYVQYRLRLWTVDSVQSENEFYFELLRNALPKQIIQEPGDSTSPKKTDVNVACPVESNNTNSPCTKRAMRQNSNGITTSATPLPTSDSSTGPKLRKKNSPYSLASISSNSFKCPTKRPCVSSSNLSEESNNQPSKTPSRSSSVSSIGTTAPKSTLSDENATVNIISPNIYDKKVPLSSINSDISRDKFSDDKNMKSTEAVRIEKLETCITELRTELNSMRHCEGVLRMQNFTLSNGEKSAKNELSQLRRDNEQLQSKLHNLVGMKQKDKQVMENLEKRLREETVAREAVEKKLYDERVRKKEEEETAARAVALVASNREKERAEEHKKCVEGLEAECSELKKRLADRETSYKRLEVELGQLRKQEKSSKETNTLMSALAAMQEKNAMLEKSLSSETRLKLDLFSALGDVKRQLEIAHSIRCQREVEIQELQARVADVLSVLPDSQNGSATQHYSTTFLENHPQPSVPLGQAQHYSTTFCSLPVSPLTQQSIDPHSMIHPNAMIRPSGIMGQLPLDPGAVAYSPSSNAVLPPK